MVTGGTPRVAAAAAADHTPVAPKIKQRKFANGDRYVGGWLNGLPEGAGKYEWADGSCYEGGWKEGAKHGVGRYLWTSGASYQGEWKHGCMHGVGAFEAPDGSRYQGGWREDLKHGLGKKIYANGDVYEGLWAGGKPHGPGRYIWVDFNEYDGEWRLGRMHGQGTFVWKTGERYDGEWKDGQEDGAGVFTFRDGSVYSGFWHGGKKHGIGLYRPAPDLQQQRSGIRPFGKQETNGGSGTRSAHSSTLGGSRTAFADAANAAAALPDEAAAEVRQPRRPGDPWSEMPTDSLGGSRSTGRGGSQQEQPGAPNSQLQQQQQPAGGVVLIKEYKDGRLVRQFPFKGSRLAAACAAFSGTHGLGRISGAAAAGSGAAGGGKGPRQAVAPFGEVLVGDHSVFDLIVQLQRGIRWSVASAVLEGGAGAGAGAAPPPLPAASASLQASDYDAVLRQEFPRSGSRSTPVHPAEDFFWKDYAPAAFRTLREQSGVPQAEYLAQVCGDQSLHLLAAGGRSGAVLFVSRDGRYVVKSATRAEAKLLLKLLPQYTQHLIRHPASLLPRFFGLHRVAVRGVKHKVHLVVMSSHLCTSLPVHQLYHLKGCTAGRSAGVVEPGAATVLKDLDLRNCFRLEADGSGRLRQQLAADTQLLAAVGIMDYSLLLAVHNRHQQAPALQQQQAVAGGNFSLHSADQDVSAAVARLQAHLTSEKVEKRLALALIELAKARMLWGAPFGKAGSHSSRMAALGATPTLVLAARPPRGASGTSLAAEAGGAGDPSRRLGQHMPGVALPLGTSPSAADKAGQQVVLFLGLVDVLQRYTLSRKLEGGLKRLTAPAASISSVSPRYYASRFTRFMAQVFR